MILEEEGSRRGVYLYDAGFALARVSAAGGVGKEATGNLESQTNGDDEEISKSCLTTETPDARLRLPGIGLRD